MSKKALLKRLFDGCKKFHLSIYIILIAIVLLSILNPISPRVILAQVNCEPWFSVKGWTGTFTENGTGSGRAGDLDFTVRLSMSGTISLNQPPTDCSSDTLQWTGVFNGSIDVFEEYRLCPQSGGPEQILTYRANGVAFSAPAFLSISLQTRTWVLQGSSQINVQSEVQDCGGTVFFTVVVPSDAGFQQSGSLPISGLDLSGSAQFQRPLHFGATMDSQKSWTLTPSGQQPPAPPPPSPPPPAQPPKDLDDQCLVAGSIIGCQNQTLGEALAVVGTPFVLHYQSDRVRGRAGANVVAVKHAQALGGWSLNVHHAYDPTEIVVFLGNGGRRSIDALGFPIPNSAGEFLIASEDGSEIYIFDSRGFHLRTLEGLTAAMRYQFSYDAADRLITVTDSNGNVTTIQRDASGNPSGIVGPFGKNTKLTVDANGFLASITKPAGEATLLTYSTDGLLLSLSDPRGGVHNFVYDLLGRLVQDKDPAGGSSTLSRSGGTDDYAVSLTTALNRTRTYQVQNFASTSGQRINTDSSGLRSVEQIIETPTSRTRTITSPDGTVTSSVQGLDPRFGLQTPVLNSLSVTTPGGLQSSLTSNRAVTLMVPNNPLSLTTIDDVTNINGRIYISTYNSASRQLTETTPMGRETTATLDGHGRPVRVQFAGLEALTLKYDGRGRIRTVTTGSGADIRTMNLRYNSDGYLHTITDPLNRTVRFAYDSAGLVIQQISPLGRVTGYTYDANGNVTTITPPGRPAHGFSLSPVDLTSAYTPPDVSAGTNQTLYVYNLDRQLTQISRPDGRTVNFAYDSAGRLNTVTSVNDIFRYTFDPTKGNLASIRAPDGIGLSYTYDGALLTGTTWVGPVSGSVSRTYDNNFRTTTLALSGTPSIFFRYDNDGLLTEAGDLKLSRNVRDGLLTSTTLGNTSDTWTYNSFGEPTEYNAAYDRSAVFNQKYTRDKLGRITRKTETIAGITDVFEYFYDLAGRLEGTKQNGRPNRTYEYDDNGNRVGVITAAGTIVGSYDQQDRLLQYGVAQYTYTANGELLSKTVGAQTTTYQYDPLGNLREVILPNGTQIKYLIDGRNRRIGKQINGTLIQGFLYQDGLKPIAEVDGSNNVVSRFVYATHSNVPNYVIKGGVTYRIFTDPLGSPRLVVNVATGAVLQQMDYDEFGVVTRDTNPGFQPFGFAGGLYDRDTTLVRFGERDYMADTGRWTIKDQIRFAGGDTNLYAYVLNDPINFTDPNGRSKNKVAAILAALELLISKGNSRRMGQQMIKRAETEEKMRQLNRTNKKKKGTPGGGSAPPPACVIPPPSDNGVRDTLDSLVENMPPSIEEQILEWMNQTTNELVRNMPPPQDDPLLKHIVRLLDPSGSITGPWWFEGQSEH